MLWFKKWNIYNDISQVLLISSEILGVHFSGQKSKVFDVWAFDFNSINDPVQLTLYCHMITSHDSYIYSNVYPAIMIFFTHTGTNVAFPLFMQFSSSVGNVTIEFPMAFLHLYLDCTCQRHLNISYLHGKLVWP